MLGRTHWAVEVDIAEAAGEEEAKLHGGLVGVPDAHAVVSHNRAHGMVARVVPLLLAQLQHLLQLLAQVPIALCQQRQLPELAHCAPTPDTSAHAPNNCFKVVLFRPQALMQHAIMRRQCRHRRCTSSWTEMASTAGALQQ